MNKFFKMAAILIVVAILASCGGDGGSGLKFPSVTNLTVNALSDSMYNISGVNIPENEGEAKAAFLEAIALLQDIDFFGDLPDPYDESGSSNISNSYARANVDVNDEIILDSKDYSDYGVTNLTGNQKYSIKLTDTSFKYDLTYKISYDYNSLNDNYSNLNKPANWVKAKVNDNGYARMNMNNINSPQEYANMAIGTASSIALAYNTDTVSGKFIFTLGLALSASGYTANNDPDTMLGPIFYGTLKVYDNAGQLKCDIKLTEDDMQSFLLPIPMGF